MKRAKLAHPSPTTPDPHKTATPILDLCAPLPRSRDESYTWPQKSGIAAIYIAGIVVPIFSVPDVRQDATGQYTGDLAFLLSLVLLGIPVIWLLLTLIHEIGHLLTGLLIGFRFEAIEIGPMRLEHQEHSWRLRSCRPFRLLSGGRVEMTLDRLRGVRKRLILLYLGGPSAVIILLLVTINGLVKANNPPAFIGALCLLDCAILHLVTSLVQRSSFSEWEDGNDLTFLRTLVTSRIKAARMVAATALQMLKRRGLDDVLLHPRWLREAYGRERWKEWTTYSSPETPIEIKAGCLERWLSDSGRYRSEERDRLLIEAGVFMACYRGDPAKAEIWFQRVISPSRVNRITMLRAEISFRCADRQYEDALTLLAQGLHELQQHRQPWVRKYEEGWRSWGDEIEKRRAGFLTSTSKHPD